MLPVKASKYPLIDIGANLTHESFASDFEQVIQRACEAGVEHMLVTGSTLSDSQAAVDLANKYPDLFTATAGIHPHHAEDYNADVGAELSKLLANEKVKAVGETGLDFFRDISPREKQLESFTAHIELAVKHDMPMFLHQRDAHEEFLAVLKNHRQDLGPVVVHCFTDTAEALNDYIEIDCHIGITGWICDERRGSHLLDCVPSIPLDRLMIETDAPYLMPRNIRPKPKTRRNEPATLPMVLEAITKVRPESLPEIANATTENAKRFFDLV